MSRNPLRRIRTASPARRNRRPGIEALEGRCLLSGVSGVTSYPIPSGNIAWYTTQGPDGNIWFTDGGTGTCDIGMVNPTTRAVTEFPLPTAGCAPREITVGPDGNIWFAEYANPKIGVVNTATHAITEFAYPSSYGHGWGIAAGPDGNLWFTTFNNYGAIGTFNLSTHAFSFFATPSLNSQPHGITAGPDGKLWFAEYGSGKVGEIDPTTHAISEFPTPTAQSNPYDITAGPDGNLWLTEAATRKVAVISPTTDAVTEIAIPGGSGPYGITTGPDGNVWFSNGQLGRVNPATDALTQVPVTATRGVTAGPDGNLWLASGSTVSVATLSPTETDLVVTRQPPSSVTAGSPFGVTVTAEDGSGNVLTSFNGPVTVALADNPGGATLGGTLTVTASNGVATFTNLSLTKAASGYTLAASAGVLAGGITSAFAVTPAAATQIVITQQPPAAVSVNAAFVLVAAVEDQFGNIVTSANNAVTVALGNNPGGATLGGTTTVTAVNGMVTFSNLTLNKKGKGYTLKLSSAGLASATTGAFNVS